MAGHGAFGFSFGFDFFGCRPVVGVAHSSPMYRAQTSRRPSGPRLNSASKDPSGLKLVRKPVRICHVRPWFLGAMAMSCHSPGLARSWSAIVFQSVNCLVISPVLGSYTHHPMLCLRCQHSYLLSRLVSRYVDHAANTANTANTAASTGWPSVPSQIAPA